MKDEQKETEFHNTILMQHVSNSMDSLSRNLCA